MIMEDGRGGISPGCKNCPWPGWSRWCKSSADSGRLLSQIVATSFVRSVCSWSSQVSSRRTAGRGRGGLLLTESLPVSPSPNSVLLSNVSLDCVEPPRIDDSRSLSLKCLHRRKRCLAEARQCRMSRKRTRKSKEREVVTGRGIVTRSQEHRWTQ